MALHLIAAMALTVGAACGPADKAVQDSLTNAFRYREVYLPEAIGDSARKLGLNTLDFDWGIWGHNLEKVLPEEPSQSVYAKVNGNTTKKQLCFSSNHLYEYIEEFIDDKFDHNEYARFAILPNDNDIVCLCEKCIEVGNSAGNASPAVVKMVKRLAERFPNHSFFTSDYRTTQSVPKDSMPANSGVLISAIDYPLSMAGSYQENQFMNRIKAWTPVTPRVVVWDYINNFDDYFTPFPVFNVLQRRLKNYRDNGVTGIFLNGSGSDLSAFSDIKAEVLAQITANPDIDWKPVVRETARKLYPVAGDAIADFMILQEDMIEKSNATLPLYDGVEGAVNTYLPKNDFIAFHDKLLKLRQAVSGKELDRLNTLLGQLALTRLEINRINGDFENVEPLLADLAYLTKQEVEGYNEAGWTIESYINDYNYLLKNYREDFMKDKLKGEKLIPLTALDSQYSDISILTDGRLGLPSNYHSGLLINSPANYTSIAVPNKPFTKKLKVWLAYNPPYRIFLPEAVTVSENGKVIGEVTPSYPKDDSGHAVVEFDIPSNATGTLTLTFYKNPEQHSMAIEEIAAF